MGRNISKLNIGFLTSWAECGHAYMTKQFRDALATKHNTFIFAGTNARPGEFLQEKKGIWDVPNLTLLKYPYMEIGKHLEDVDEWIKINKIDIVFFNECYDWNLVYFCKDRAKVITYLDYFTQDWIPYFKIFDKVIVCAKHAYEIFKDFENVVFINWGVNDEIFHPTLNEGKSTFFHSAGWGGLNWRKCSPEILRIFNEICTSTDITLFFHTQKKLEYYPIDCQQILKDNKRIITFVGSISHPGLYHKGIINLAISKLEGLGMYIPEGLSCGMPTITSNAPPMNQFIKNGYNGLLVQTNGFHYRQDPYYFPEYDIDLESLKSQMILLATDERLQEQMSINARQFILENHSFSIFSKNVINAIQSIYG